MALAGRVVAMTGEAFVIAANGNKRKLQLGDQVELGDTIETPRGVDVDLELTAGRVIHIVSEQQVWLNAAITETTRPSELDSAVDLATIDKEIEKIRATVIDAGKGTTPTTKEKSAAQKRLDAILRASSVKSDTVISTPLYSAAISALKARKLPLNV